MFPPGRRSKNSRNRRCRNHSLSLRERGEHKLKKSIPSHRLVSLKTIRTIEKTRFFVKLVKWDNAAEHKILLKEIKKKGRCKFNGMSVGLSH